MWIRGLFKNVPMLDFAPAWRRVASGAFTARDELCEKCGLALATNLIDCASRARLGHTGRSFRQPANRFSTVPRRLGTIVKANAAQALQPARAPSAL